MKCPKCEGEFSTRYVKDVKVEECKQCHGVWFDATELEEATKEVDQDLRWMDFDLWKNQDSIDVSRGTLMCPRCNIPMAMVKYGPTEVQVDTCTNCHGIWLDKGEFEEIISALEDELSSMSEDEYWDAAMKEAWELIDGDKGFISEWRDFRTVLRFLQYRVLVENPKVQSALTALTRSSPFQ
jgi:Zn-finger nucleic acid-binding protein